MKVLLQNVLVYAIHTQGAGAGIAVEIGVLAEVKPHRCHLARTADTIIIGDDAVAFEGQHLHCGAAIGKCHHGNGVVTLAFVDCLLALLRREAV